VSEKAWILYATTYGTCQGCKLHATGRHVSKIPVDCHDAVGNRKNGGNALTAATSCHRINKKTVEAHAFNFLPRCISDILITPFKLPILLVQTFSFLYGLVWPLWIDFIRCPTIKPVICAAQTSSFGADNAHMTRCKGLAERA